MWVIKRTDQWGGWLAIPGSQNSWTKALQLARTFETREHAQAECCPGNEVPQNVSDIMRGGRN
jgi:hypothetical protein